MHFKKLSALFFLVFMGLSFLMTLFYFAPAFSSTGLPASGEVIKGGWASRFEKNFGEKIPAYAPSRDFWGEIEYDVFHQGRKGVVIGDQGWLFTDEEFSCPRGNVKTLESNLQYIEKISAQLKEKSTELVIVLIPAKARVLKQYLGGNELPSCRKNLYKDTISFLKQKKIPAIDLMATAKSSSPENMYLKTDTHWTPGGAKLAAQEIAHAIPVSLASNASYETKIKRTQQHKGDLMRYTPGVNGNEIAADDLAVYSTTAQSKASASDQDLFGDTVPPVTLVGTSYSANPLWNFEGFLKQSLKTDILNAADEGKGPFAVMTKYIEGRAWKDNPPRVVIWELPERYLIASP